MPDGGVLRRFAVAVIEDEGLAEARLKLIAAVGAHRCAQVAAVVAGFSGINRVADATGIQLNFEMQERSRDLVESLGLAAMQH